MEFINEVNTKIDACIESESDTRLKKEKRLMWTCQDMIHLLLEHTCNSPKSYKTKKQSLMYKTEKSTNAWNGHFEWR